MLSRYQDVSDALREPALRQAGPEKAPALVREDVSDALPLSKISGWQEKIEPLADCIIAALPPGRPVDLVSEVLRPWSLAVTTSVLGLDAARARQLAALAPYLSVGDNGLGARRRSPKGLVLAGLRRIASARLKRLLRSVRLPGAQSLFLGLSQTLPEFLASAWLGLLENPDQIERLRAEPHLMSRPSARGIRRYHWPGSYARAEQRSELYGNRRVTITEGERVILRVDLANRDPEHFADPNLLDLARRNSGHLALGLGPHSCVGALLVRMAAISATRAFAEKMATAELIPSSARRRGFAAFARRSCLLRGALRSAEIFSERENYPFAGSFVET